MFLAPSNIRRGILFTLKISSRRFSRVTTHNGSLPVFFHPALFESKPGALLKLGAAKGIAPSRSPLPCSPTLPLKDETVKYRPPFCSCACKCLTERDAMSAHTAPTSSVSPAVRKPYIIGIDHCAYLYVDFELG